MNIIGLLVFAFLIIFKKKKPKKFYNHYYIPMDGNWGLELGMFFLSDKTEDEYILHHEAGHGLQNIVFGPFALFIWIASAVRFNYRNLTKNKKHPPYDSIWFEGQATEWGYKYYK
jgi:hypothetical protein